jgi:hypothetical protein
MSTWNPAAPSSAILLQSKAKETEFLKTGTWSSLPRG